MKTKTKTAEENKKKTVKNENNMGFKKGMLEEFVSKKQANIHKGNAKKKGRQKKSPTMNVFQTGLMTKKQRKRMEF